MCGWQVKLCDPLVTHGPYLSDLEIRLGTIKRYTNGSFIYLLTYLLSVPVLSADLVVSHGGSVDLKSWRYDCFMHVRTQPRLGRISCSAAQHGDTRDVVTVGKLLGEYHRVWITLGVREVADDIIIAQKFHSTATVTLHRVQSGSVFSVR